MLDKPLFWLMLCAISPGFTIPGLEIVTALFLGVAVLSVLFWAVCMLVSPFMEQPAQRAARLRQQRPLFLEDPRWLTSRDLRARIGAVPLSRRAIASRPQ